MKRSPENIRDREAAWQKWSADLPDDVLPEARTAWEKTIQAQAIDAHHALRGLGHALAEAIKARGKR